MNKLILLSSVFLISSVSYADLKKQISAEGFEFVKEIPAPAGMTGWAGHMNQHPGTVFISNDQKYYIMGDLYNAQGENISIEALNTHVKDAVLDDVWKSIEKSTWIQDGENTAARVVYVFSDPNCPYCHQFWEAARPWVNSGKVQLRHIQVGVIREESRGQIATILNSSDPAKVFNDYNKKKGKERLVVTQNISKSLQEKIDYNESLMDKYGFFSTPTMVWKNQQGEFKSMQGMAKDLQEVFEK
ncbi:thiol:disulfide interchange protein DsbG [Acinetobacter sp. DSM 11652]|uniref:thiol:disulfide interchange protein DsbG n=1 Tax=Acinetobacter sp. DSM 11652 TaxID=346222 RepID=UPI000B876638|nr:thiol:disulfide interchange protein DsbG [Acinetobacter sp. DSM 11652]